MTDYTNSSEFLRYKLKTEFHSDHVVHTTYNVDLAARKRRTAVKTKWTRKRHLGSGGYGIVSLEQDDACELRAVKRLPVGMQNVDHTRELKALAELSDRDDLFVRFMGWYENSDFIHFAMEYIPYGDLGQYIKTETATARSNAREITSQLLEGLAVLEERKFCHRDLKPQNVLIASMNPIWVKIADFGISKHFRGTQLKTKLGSAGYIAPEVIGLLQTDSSRNFYTIAIDLWALGCIVHEILTCELPFIGTSDDSASFISGVASGGGAQIDMGQLYGFCNGSIEFPVDSLQRCQASSDAIEFVKGLMVAEPGSRLSVQAAQRSPWLVSNRPNSTTSSEYENHALHITAPSPSQAITILGETNQPCNNPTILLELSTTSSSDVSEPGDTFLSELEAQQIPLLQQSDSHHLSINTEQNLVNSDFATELDPELREIYMQWIGGAVALVLWVGLTLWAISLTTER